MNATSTIELHTGNAMPILGLGTWQLSRDTADTIAHAIDLGYRMIDTSGDYGTQPGVGGAIRASSVPREKLFITTKVEETDNAYEATVSYLKEMGLEYADLVLIHRPPHNSAGLELWNGLIQARNDGLTHDIGVSNYTIEEIEELIEKTGETPVVNQIEWSPFGHSLEMLEFCNDNDILIQAYSPLTRTQELADERLLDIAEHYGKSPAQILIRWNIQQETIPLPKANSWDHLAENIDVFDFEIDDDDMAELNTFNQHFSALGKLAYVM